MNAIDFWFAYPYAGARGWECGWGMGKGMRMDRDRVIESYLPLVPQDRAPLRGPR